jgi:hypothetical protein
MTTRIAGVTMTAAAAETVAAVNAGLGRAAELATEQNVICDLGRLRSHSLTAEQLLAECLSGAEGSAVTGWREYVDALVVAAK